MKKLLLILSIAMLFTACDTPTSPEPENNYQVIINNEQIQNGSQTETTEEFFSVEISGENIENIILRTWAFHSHSSECEATTENLGVGALQRDFSIAGLPIYRFAVQAIIQFEDQEKVFFNCVYFPEGDE